MSAWIDFEPKRETPQARSQDRLQAGRISCASIDGDDEEVSETQTGRLCRSTGSRAAKFGSRNATADSLWQQGRRAEAWRPLWLGEDGMRRRELIFLHSASADGCNAWRTLPFPLAPIYAIARASRKQPALMKALLDHECA